MKAFERCANLDPTGRGTLTDPQHVMVAAMAAIRTTSNGLAVSDLRKADPLRLNIIGQLAAAVGQYRASDTPHALDNLLMYISTVEFPKTEQPFTPWNVLLPEPEHSLVSASLARFGGIPESWPLADKSDQLHRALAADSTAGVCYLLVRALSRNDSQLRYLHILLANPVLTQVFGALLTHIAEFRAPGHLNLPSRLNPIDVWIAATRHTHLDSIPEAAEPRDSTTTVEDV